MSVLRGLGLSLKLDFIHDRFLHSPCTPNKKTRGLTMNSLFFLFSIRMWFPRTKLKKKLPGTLGSCLQFFAFQPQSTCPGVLKNPMG